MKKILFTCIISIFCLNAKSQIDSLIYGITAFYSGPGIYLAKINPQSGAVTNISATMANYNNGSLGQTIDPIHHIFYLTPDSILLSFNLINGQLINSKPIINSSGELFKGISYNCWDTSLYGLSIDIAGQTVKLSRINPYTGLVSTISGNSVASSYNSLTWSTIDPFNGIYYFETNSSTSVHLIGVGLKTGAVISDEPIGIISSYKFGPLVFNCKDSIIYGLVGNMNDGRKLAKINPHTGIVTTISPNFIANSIFNDPAAIEPFQGIYYFAAADSTFKGADLSSGLLVTQPLIISYIGSYFSNFIYNFTCYYNPPVSIIEKSLLKDINIFPSPAKDKISIDFKVNGDYFISIINIIGQEVISKKSENAQTINVDVSQLSNGIYTIKVFQNNALLTSSKFIINR